MVARRWSIRDRLPRSGVVKLIYLEAETRDHGSDSDPGTLIRYRCGGSVYPQTDRPGCSAVSVVPGESSGCYIDYKLPSAQRWRSALITTLYERTHDRTLRSLL